MHTVRLLLKTTAYDKDVIDKRFYALSHIHNVLVKQTVSRLIDLDHNKEYQLLLPEYITLRNKEKLLHNDKKKLQPEEQARKEYIVNTMDTIRSGMGLSEYGLQHYITKCVKRYRKQITSMQVQKEATRVWHGAEKVIFGNGKAVHFKKAYMLSTIGGKNNTNGVVYNKDNNTVSWLGIKMKCIFPSSDTSYDYVKESLNHKISYCELCRKMFPDGYHYYVIVYLQGDAPHKIHNIGTGTMGIDPGVSSIAGISDTKAILEELAPKSRDYNKKIQIIQKHMDISKRISNPNKFNADGTIIKDNKDRWKFSKTYLKNRRLLQTMYRQKSAYIKQSHEILCNKIFEDSNNFKVESMCYKALVKRKKKTERNKNVSDIKQKNGSVKQVRKYKKKKRFGKSSNDRAPALFLAILKRKAVMYGGTYTVNDAKAIKASQYNHIENTCHKTNLDQRSKMVGGHKVQRDLYSAFLHRYSKQDHVIRQQCLDNFDNFLLLQDELIISMKDNNISMKQCFGF